MDAADQAYWEAKIRPMLEAYPDAQFIGEIGDNDKLRFLGGATALLFPITWPEPFGLVVIEAMACGTPVIAFGRGSVSEIVEDGKTGFIVHSVGQAVNAVRSVADLDRTKIGAQFECHFTAERMARDYMDIYRALSAPVRKAPKPVMVQHRDIAVLDGLQKDRHFISADTRFGHLT